jgi:hypothetical protein
MTTEINTPPTNTAPIDTPEWVAALRGLRARYRESRDLFSAHEMAHLRFLRWLVQTGRLAL